MAKTGKKSGSGEKDSHEDHIRKRKEVAKRSNAIALLLQYLTNRCEVLATDLDKEVIALLSAVPKHDRQPGAFDPQHLREGKRHLSNVEAEVIRNYIVSVLERVPEVVALDYDFIRTMLIEAGLAGRIGANTFDYRALDVAILQELGLHLDHKDTVYNHEYLKYAQLFKQVGGVWLLVRKTASSDKPRYHLSLLNIKPQDYISTTQKDLRYVKTFALHFSLRVRRDGKKTGVIHTFFGRVVREVDNFVNLVGAKEKTPVPAYLSFGWEVDGGPDDHAHILNGLITSVENGSTTYSAPFAAIHVSNVDISKSEKWDVDLHDLPEPSSKLYGAEVDLKALLNNAVEHKSRSKFWEDFLIEDTLPNQEQNIRHRLTAAQVPSDVTDDLISQLKKAIEAVEERLQATAQNGYFRAQP